VNKLNALLLAGWLVALGTFAALYIKFYNVTHTIVIHFDAAKGIDFLGTRGDVIRIGLLGIALVIVNTALVKLFEHRERMLAWAITGATFGILVIVLIAAMVIVVNN
jgi:hypothetical protein